MRVLLADGDKEFLDVAQDYLSTLGHEVYIARNGLEAVAGLRRGLPNVVVLEQELLWGAVTASAHSCGKFPVGRKFP